MVNKITKWTVFAAGVFYSILPHDLHTSLGLDFGIPHEMHVLIGVILLGLFAYWTIKGE